MDQYWHHRGCHILRRRKPHLHKEPHHHSLSSSVNAWRKWKPKGTYCRRHRRRR
jgi:hypothetical protein